MNLNALKLAAIAFSAVALSGCTLTSSSSTAVKYDGGVWRSADAGGIFAQANDILTTKGKVATLANQNINKMAIDPQDDKTVYLAAEGNGVFVSTDAGVSWQAFGNLGKTSATELGVDPKDKCVVYAVIGNKLYKTENCGRDFTNVYYHQKAGITLTALAVDTKVSKVVYLGTSDGEILKSLDGGITWTTVNRVSGDKVIDIIVDPFESRIVYAGTAKSGLLKSVDSGMSWNDLGPGLKTYIGSSQYRQLIYDYSTANSLMLISKFGILRTFDGGGTWKVIELLPETKNLDILAAAINPKNSQEFYYVTASGFLKTIDGGVKWSSRKLPFTQRYVSGMYVGRADANVIYLATKLIKK